MRDWLIACGVDGRDGRIYMLVPEVSVAMGVTREERQRAADRRAQEPRVGEPETVVPVVEDNPSYDAAYYASRMKSEIWRLGVFAEEPQPEPDREGDACLFSFFGHLSVLLLAV